MEKYLVYFLGIGLYIIVLIVSLLLFRKTDINNLKFLLLSGLTLLMINVLYLIAVRIIFNNSYAGLFLVYAITILNLISIPTILILFIIKLFKK